MWSLLIIEKISIPNQGLCVQHHKSNLRAARFVDDIGEVQHGLNVPTHEKDTPFCPKIGYQKKGCVLYMGMRIF